jgi:hypothetical protein
MPRIRPRRRPTTPRPRSVPVPDGLASRAIDRPDLADAWQLSRAPHLPTDPQVWADAIFRDPPRWVVGMLLVRHVLVGFVGIDRGGPSAFDTLAVEDGDLLLGTDAGHLDFRASVTVEERTVTLSTVARANNRRGRAYLRVVSRLHPAVVRAMLRRAGRTLGRTAGAGRPRARRATPQAGRTSGSGSGSS